MPFQIKKSQSFLQLESQQNSLENSTLFTLVSKAVIEEFQKIVQDSEILGAEYHNPYTNKTENFPSNHLKFNSKHLQILARNESVNTTGSYNFNLYGGLLGDDKICRIRHLQKLVVNQSEVKAEYFGGFPRGEPINQIQGGGNNFFLVDQSGFQWQRDKRNTGCIFFYPENATDQSYNKFQKDMYRVTFQEDRPDKPSENKLAVTWNGDRGVIDLDLLRKGFKEEFKQAFISANHAFSQDKSDDKHCLRFNKAGLGFFAEGVINGSDKSIKQDKFCQARLEGIAEALDEISQSVKNGQSSFSKSPKFDALELPFSADQHIPGYNLLAKSIKDNAQKIGIGEVFIGKRDALEVKSGYKVALTNCADPHAMVGNEGEYGSVDAMIATNCRKSSQNVNVAYNQNFVELSYDLKSLAIPKTNSNSSVVEVNDNHSSQNFELNPVTSQSPTTIASINNAELEVSKNKLKDLIKKFNWNPVTEAYQKGNDGARWMKFKSKSIEEKDIVIGEYGLTKSGEKSIVLDLRRDNSGLSTRFDSYQFYFLDDGQISIAGKKTENGETKWTNNLEKNEGVIDPVLYKSYIDQACTYIEKNISKSDPKAPSAPTDTQPKTSVSVYQSANIEETLRVENTLREVTEELAKKQYIFPQQRGWNLLGDKLGDKMEAGLNSSLQKSYADSEHQLIIEDEGGVIVLDKKQLDKNQNFSVVSDSSKRLKVMEGFLRKINGLDSHFVGKNVIDIIKDYFQNKGARSV